MVTTSVSVKLSPTALNAVKHGILSSQILLPSESEADYAGLLSELVDEYEPQTITEKTLVQDIANTIWRKRRLLSAERASISTGLNNSLEIPVKLINEASPVQSTVQDSGSVRHLLAMDAITLSSYRKTILGAFEALDEAENIKDLSNLFEYLESTLPYSISQRLGELAEIEALTQDSLIPTVRNLLHSELQAIASIEAIRQQAYGSACSHINFDVIARYDSALDRKLLRLLDALMTVQARRKAKGKTALSMTGDS